MQHQPVVSSSTPPKLNSISDCPESFAKWYCLNGATCFSVKIQESILYNCWCPVGFHGLRCDFKYITEGKRVEATDDQQAPGREQSSAIRLVGDGSIDKINANDNNFRVNVEIYLIIVYLMAFTFLIFVLIIVSIQIIRKLRSISGSSRTATAATVIRSDRPDRRVINPNNNNDNDTTRRIVAVELDQILKRNLERRLALGRNETSGNKEQQSRDRPATGSLDHVLINSPGHHRQVTNSMDNNHDGQREHRLPPSPPPHSRQHHHQQRPASSTTPLEPIWFC